MTGIVACADVRRGRPGTSVAPRPWWRSCLLALALLLGLVRGASAQRELTKIPDPDPEIERRALQVAEGFEVNLFAADPLLAKPIQINFDAAGRLWVACSEVYPQIQPGQKADDKILILEDRDGDGRADRTTVFAGGLLIPTGVEPGDGGAYVADSTDLLHLADTDGDGKADRRRILLSGFGTEDTHHILHTFRWGPEGLLYFNQSIYIHSHIETPYGVRRLNGGGIWQFRPETRRLEVFARGFINPWGHHVDRWGQGFATDGANGEGITYLVPGAAYPTAVGAARILEGLNPGSPKHCGAEVVSGRHLPPDWQGNILTNDFRGHRVCRFVLSEDGSGYASREKAELIKTNHVGFRPVDVKMGPDGAIYIADWYNPIIQHGEVDFRDPRRDHTHGRIWRVTAKGRPLVPRPPLVGASTAALLDALTAPEDWTRHQAKRLLKERGAAQVVPALADWVARHDSAHPEQDHQLLEALWVYQALDVVEPRLLARVLAARDPHARAAATRVVSHWHTRLADPMALLAERVQDAHPQVRLEAVRALGQLADARAVELALQVLDRPMDRFLDYGLWLTVRELEPAWLPPVQKGELDFSGRVHHLTFALQAVGTSEAVRPLVQLLKAGKVPPGREEDVLTLIASLGGPSELTLAFDLVTREAVPPGRRASLLQALAQAARQRKLRPDGDLTRLAPLLSSDDEAVHIAAARLAGLWQVESLRPRLRADAGAATTSDAVRRAALEGLALLGGAESRATLAQLASASHPLKVRLPAVVALAGLDLSGAAPLAADALAAAQPDRDAQEVFSAFLERKNGTNVLARALADRKLPADVAKVGLRTARSTGRDAGELVAALTRAGGLTAGAKSLAPEQLRQLVAEVAQHGDAARGEQVFRRKDLACLKCHAVAGAGGLVGPDLASIGASAQVDYLIESLLVPSKAIKENYHTLVVATKEGRLVTGVQVRQTKTELILRDAEDRELAIPLNAIEEKATGGSLMPEGLADTITHAELLDLVRFLSELGKVGPYAPSAARLVRRWQALEPAPATLHHLHRTSYASAAGDDPALAWAPVYSQVAGILPLGDLPRIEIRRPLTKELHALAFVRCQVEVSTAGKVQVAVNATDGLSLWVDQVPVDVHDKIPLDLTAGRHTLTFGLDLNRRREGLRCEIDEAPGSPARVRIVQGK